MIDHVTPSKNQKWSKLRILVFLPCLCFFFLRDVLCVTDMEIWKYNIERCLSNVSRWLSFRANRLSSLFEKKLCFLSSLFSLGHDFCWSIKLKWLKENNVSSLLFLIQFIGCFVISISSFVLHSGNSDFGIWKKKLQYSFLEKNWRMVMIYENLIRIWW